MQQYSHELICTGLYALSIYLGVLVFIFPCSIAVFKLLISASFIRFDAIVSADAFEKLKPAPDIFLAASKILKVPTSEVYWLIFPSFLFLFEKILYIKKTMENVADHLQILNIV